MTDEEKAEEYANACRGKIKDIHWQDVKYAVLYGLSEGRKEKCFEQNKDGTIRPCEVMKDNEELQKEISVLLSCKNCPENKGGYICEKEYNDKCLAQKIEYIKELEEQIEQMKCYLNCANNSDDCLGKNCKGCKNWKLAE